MATLLLTAVGTVLGGPIGGAIGALAGRQIDTAISGGRSIRGPRLKDRDVQSSTYGEALPMHFGTVRTAGTVIWSTELVEHQETSSGGKGQPALTSYSYTASFAVALASRPIVGIGRIWADGNLLRGAAGDLKVGGSIRLHTGHGDQAPDPLMIQAEAAGRCPAYRGLAYVVFENLELANFGNRLPTLSFEVFAGSSCSVPDIIETILPEARCERCEQEFTGFTIDQGTAADVVGLLSSAIPLTVQVDRDKLLVSQVASADSVVPMLSEPSASEETDTQAMPVTGWSSRRDPLPHVANCAIRYYDRLRDFQPGFQRGKGRSERGELRTIDLPAVLGSGEAQAIANAATLRLSHSLERIAYRTAQIDPRLLSASHVRVPIAKGLWLIEDWEWQKDGVLLNLVSMPTTVALAALSGEPGDAGRYNAPSDIAITPTILSAFGLPWDGTGSDNATPLFVAASSSSAGWRGAALFGRIGDGQAGLTPLGHATARRAVTGHTVGSLPTGSPLLCDQTSHIDVQLTGDDLVLQDADIGALMSVGANRALVGEEIIQFASAVPLGAGRWRLSALLRGRGGTEWAIGGHGASPEVFVLLDDKLTRIDLSQNGAADAVVAVGLSDPAPVVAAIASPGRALEPLSPVHGKAELLADGAVRLSWVRRSRGSWCWSDEVDAPLHEEREAWDIVLGDPEAPLARWTSTTSSIVVPPSATSSSASGSSRFLVRQIGRRSMSKPLIIPFP